MTFYLKILSVNSVNFPADKSHGLRALPVAFRRDQSAVGTWTETIAECGTWIAVEATAVARAFRRWQAFRRMQETLRALQEARIRAVRS